MKELTITLSIETLNAALAALTKMPYEFAQPHIDAIRSRASAALAEQMSPSEEKAGTTD